MIKTQRHKDTKTQRHKDTKTQRHKDTKKQEQKYRKTIYKKKTKETKNIKKYKNIGGVAALPIGKDYIDRIINGSFPGDFRNKENLLKYNDEGSYSITSINIFAPLIEYIQQLFPNRSNFLTLIDANANMGSDTIKFGLSKLFSHIDSIELETENYELLNNNIKVYSDENLIPTNLNIESHNENCFTFINRIPEDKIVNIMYFDPPWKINGEPWSKQQTNLNLTLSDEEGKLISMPDIVSMFQTKANVFIFKLPKNYNFNLFNSLNTEFNIYILDPTKNPFQSIRFIIISKKDMPNLPLKKLTYTSYNPYIPPYRRPANSF